MEIARILFAGSDVLLLDEPTNHLDSDAKEWLLGFMRSYRGALLVISHDLDLLDEAITRVLHLDRHDEESVGTMYEYKGTYSQYLVARQKDEVRLAKMAQRQAKEIDRLQTVVDRFGAKATKAAMAHSIEKRIVRLEANGVEAPKASRSVHVRFPAPPQSGRVVLEGEGLAVRYGELEVFRGVDLAVERGERLLIMGLNGAGKTSLLRVLAGERASDEGGYRLGHKVVAGYYAQEHEGIHAGRTILEHLREQVPQRARSRAAQPSSAPWGSPATRCTRTPARSRVARRPSWRWASWWPAATTCCCSTSPPTTSTPARARRWPRACAAGPAASCSSATTLPSCATSSPTRCSSCPRARLDHWADDYLDLVELA